MMLRTIVVDDEPLAVERLCALLARLPDVNVVATANSGQEALDLVRTTKCDLMLLDVQMPELSGFDTVDLLASQAISMPSIVLVTAYDIHALGAFDLGVVDFLTKPVRIKRLETAIDRVRVERRNAAAASQLSKLGHALPGTEGEREAAPGELWISRRGEAVRIDLSEVLRVQAEGEYVRLFLPEANYLHRAALSAIYDRLDPAAFVRIHRSTVVRRADIAAVKRTNTGGYTLALKDGLSFPVGKTYRAAVRALRSAA
jgi:DNA-binding LytR/AlgR family response regulator